VITRFDHAVIAVADLHRAIEAYRALGFDVFPGGRHEHRGTHNALIRFGGADYIELLGVYDSQRAIDLLSPTDNGPVQEMLERDSEGPFEVKIEVEDLMRARLALSGIEFAENAAPGELRPPTDASLGARLVFTKQADPKKPGPTGMQP
jgi:catechol 2,3-dioxygenase-like lactoylglutathione lyase family enzyme